MYHGTACMTWSKNVPPNGSQTLRRPTRRAIHGAASRHTTTTRLEAARVSVFPRSAVGTCRNRQCARVSSTGGPAAWPRLPCRALTSRMSARDSTLPKPRCFLVARRKEGPTAGEKPGALDHRSRCCGPSASALPGQGAAGQIKPESSGSSLRVVAAWSRSRTTESLLPG
jgi:hypothetical protein